MSSCLSVVLRRKQARSLWTVPGRCRWCWTLLWQDRKQRRLVNGRISRMPIQYEGHIPSPKQPESQRRLAYARALCPIWPGNWAEISDFIDVITDMPWDKNRKQRPRVITAHKNLQRPLASELSRSNLRANSGRSPHANPGGHCRNASPTGEEVALASQVRACSIVRE